MEQRKIAFMNDTQIVEGLIMAFVFPLVTFLLRNKLERSSIHYVSIPLFITWICRKFGLNLYIYIRNNLRIKPFTLYI